MPEEVSAKKQPRSKKSRQASSCKNDSDFTRETFIDRMLEQPVERGVVSRVANHLNIHSRTALRWQHLDNETEQMAYKRSEQDDGPKSTFTAVHNAYIYELLDNDHS
ncbi:hypothetical protein G6F46_009150 [Rhizopus delemar]|uniref:Homeodomain-like DNA binding domain-containing transcription factor n=2 Tax=Rhizopus TaxID=4842 RepID=A0A9P6Z139_9FUNG|nr:hypothetical protein G6F36_006502 [Rhizopus arrhizus]KAG1453553.1 hypothetical protein G6F55_008078 [Rhizopus delemar]KAG1493364.1 hypothetical protein G6F54_008632 [Rhizopus delemar]KAG1508210.1 hypothetical protein G6F53_008369 [Rhizopus delemar]KAG1515979.1 hypothetical protein G6F52_009552 [Rhizopus delemar]